jgi:hypothetical protein
MVLGLERVGWGGHVLGFGVRFAIYFHQKSSILEKQFLIARVDFCSSVQTAILILVVTRRDYETMRTMKNFTSSYVPLYETMRLTMSIH